MAARGSQKSTRADLLGEQWKLWTVLSEEVRALVKRRRMCSLEKTAPHTYGNRGNLFQSDELQEYMPTGGWYAHTQRQTMNRRCYRLRVRDERWEEARGLSMK